MYQTNITPLGNVAKKLDDVAAWVELTNGTERKKTRMKMEIELPKDGLPSDRHVDSLKYGIPKKSDWILLNGGVWEDIDQDY